MSAKPRQGDIINHGVEIATLKASMPRKKWIALVKKIHARGYTVNSGLSNTPDPLKERTGTAIRRQAERTVAAAYKPAMAELTRREKAEGFLSTKRKSDEAAYRTWMMGEVDKLDAQGRAADATLATQQSTIASDLSTAQAAAKADSLKRVAGGVSDTSQSTALDTTAADAQSRQHVAAAREHTAALTKVGADANQISRAALIATAAVRAATGEGEHYKTLGGIAADRTQALAARAKDTEGIVGDLRKAETAKAQTVEELNLAATQLQVKREDLALTAKTAQRKFGLETKKFNLAKFTAQNQVATENAKITLGYDKILAANGRAAADAALQRWAVKYKAAHTKPAAAEGTDPKTGVSKDERTTYRGVETVRTRIAAKRAKGKSDHRIRQELLADGYDNVTIDVANDLTRNNGKLSPHGVDKAHRIGIQHVGYFWGIQSIRPQTGTPVG